MNIARIVDILRECLGVADDNGDPLPGCEVVDVWADVVLQTDKVREHAAEMIELLRDWPSESWGQPVPPLDDEINYLIAGGVLGDQQHAFVLFAFGKLLGWWQVMDPHSMLGLAKDDEMAQRMAGMGMVSILGYQPTTGS